MFEAPRPRSQQTAPAERGWHLSPCGCADCSGWSSTTWRSSVGGLYGGRGRCVSRPMGSSFLYRVHHGGRWDLHLALAAAPGNCDSSPPAAPAAPQSSSPRVSCRTSRWKPDPALISPGLGRSHSSASAWPVSSRPGQPWAWLWLHFEIGDVCACSPAAPSCPARLGAMDTRAGRAHASWIPAGSPWWLPGERPVTAAQQLPAPAEGGKG